MAYSSHFLRTFGCSLLSFKVGAYRDSQGRPWVLPSVREAEARMSSAHGANKEYAPIDGDAEFVHKALEFAYGAESSNPLAEGRVAGVQTLSGTGACRVAGMFFAKFLGKGHPIYLSDPTWGNHVGIMKEAGLEVGCCCFLLVSAVVVVACPFLLLFSSSSSSVFSRSTATVTSTPPPKVSTSAAW
jgi:aspartate/tyrosine/aromatic aminotransferase